MLLSKCAMQLLINLGCILFGFALGIYASRQGFKMGRHTVDRPMAPEGKQKTGQPVLSEYDPWDDAMGSDEVRETVK